MLFYTYTSQWSGCVRPRNQGKKKLLLKKPLSKFETDLILHLSGELSSQIQSIPIPGGAVR